MIPSGITSIEEYAFYGCKNLTRLSLSDSLISIGINAFGRCSALNSVLFPEGLVTIESNAFEGCNLDSVAIPARVNYIGKQAFSQNDGLLSIMVSHDNEFYDSRGGCNAIIEKNSNKLVAGTFTSIIPESVTTIGKYAFYFCQKLESIEILSGISSIEEYAFYGCKSLSYINSMIMDVGSLEIHFDSSSNKFTPFRDIPSNCTWRVPSGTSSKYKAQPWWVSTWKIIDPADLNKDGRIDIADAVSILNLMAESTYSEEADINNDNKVDIADFVTILNIMAVQ